MKAAEAGNSYGAETALLGIIEMRRRNSIPAMPNLAVSAVQMGDLAWAQKKTEDAFNLYRAAEALDPSLSDAYYSQARVQLHKGLRGFLPAIESAVKGWFAPLYLVHGRIYFYSRLAFILLVTLIVVGVAFSLILLIKYNHLLVHNAVEKYGSRFSPELIQLVVWVILFIPIFAFAGLFWLAPFWLLLFWRYSQNSERILAIIFFLVFAISYPVYQRIAHTSGATVDSEISPYIRVFVEGPSITSIADFEDYYNTHHQDQDGSILLASLYVADNQMERGVRLLQKHILDHPNDPRAYNNLGAIFFQQEEMDSALKLTQKAYTLDTTNLVYVFNVSRSYRATFNFSEATRLLEAARSADPKLIAKLEETPPDNLVPVLPRYDLVLQRIHEKNGDLFSKFMNPFTFVALGMLILAALMNLGASHKRDLAKSCTKCGTAYCIKCQTHTKISDYCTQCLHIFIKKDGVSPASRKEKMGEIGVFTRRQHLLSRISSLILPGANHLYENDTFRGALILLLWVFLIVVLWFNWKFNMTYLEPPGSATVLNLVCVVTMVVIYFLANINLVRRTS